MLDRNSKKRLAAMTMLVLVVLAAAIFFQRSSASPPPTYRFNTPPPGPNARPDPPNAGKLKRLPGALSPGGAASGGSKNR